MHRSAKENTEWIFSWQHELIAGDIKKRVVISVHQFDASKLCAELIGCMSFGVQRLYEQPVSGWFYLLAEDIGSLKHRRVCSQRSRNKRSKKHRKVSIYSSATVNQTILIDVGESGERGFSVSGSHPTCVARVQPGSAAAKSGLITGDLIISIDNIDVQQKNSGFVADIVRSAVSRPIKLEVARRIFDPTLCQDSGVRYSGIFETRPDSPSRQLSLPAPEASDLSYAARDAFAAIDQRCRISSRKLRNRKKPSSDEATRRRASHSSRSRSRKAKDGSTSFPVDRSRNRDDEPEIIELEQSPRRMQCPARRTSPLPPLPPGRPRLPSANNSRKIKPAPLVSSSDNSVSRIAPGYSQISSVDQLYETLRTDMNECSDGNGLNVGQQTNEVGCGTNCSGESVQLLRAVGVTDQVADQVAGSGTVTAVNNLSSVAFCDDEIYTPMSRNTTGNILRSCDDDESHYVDMAAYRSQRLRSSSSIEAETLSVGRGTAQHVGQHSTSRDTVKSSTNSGAKDGDYVRLKDVSLGRQKARCADPFGLLQFSATTFYARPSSTSTEASLKIVTISDTECEVFDSGQGQQETKVISTKKTGACSDAKPRKMRRNAIKEFFAGKFL